jgi:hypothetical protein
LTLDDKVRLRTEAELIAQNNGLIILKKILDSIGVINYLSSGTLLGAVRDNDFIPWDWDVQMYLITENAYPLRYKITKLLEDSGFTIHKFNDSEDSLKWDARKQEAIFELTAWYLQGKWRYRKKKSMRVPSYLFEGEYNINFKGLNYRTLNPPEEYLEFCYGDWKTPIRTSDKEVYSTSKHLRKYTTINKFVLFFDKAIKKLITFISKS